MLEKEKTEMQPKKPRKSALRKYIDSPDRTSPEHLASGISDPRKRMFLWQQFLSNSSKAARGDPEAVSIQRLEHSWSKLKDEGPYQRNEFQYIDQPAIFLVRAYVRAGQYPPPEILLTLIDCFDEYLSGQSGIDLKSALLGKLNAKKFKVRCHAVDVLLSVKASIDGGTKQTEAWKAAKILHSHESQKIEHFKTSLKRIAPDAYAHLFPVTTPPRTIKTTGS